MLLLGAAFNPPEQAPLVVNLPQYTSRTLDQEHTPSCCTSLSWLQTHSKTDFFIK